MDAVCAKVDAANKVFSQMNVWMTLGTKRILIINTLYTQLNPPVVFEFEQSGEDCLQASSTG